MILGALLTAVAHAAALLGAFALASRWRTGETAADLLLALLVKILLMSTAVLAAGWTGLLTPAGLGVPAVAALALLLGLRAWRHLPHVGPKALPLAAWAGIAAVVLRAALQVWFFAPHNGDALGYHLPKIAEWIRAGAFTRYMGADDLVTLPAGFEIVEAGWVVFLRHDLLIEMAGLEFLAVGSLAVAGLAARMGLAPGAAAWAGVLYAVTPGTALQAVGGLNDAPVASLVLATLLLVDLRAHVATVAIAAGLGVGIKGTYAYAALPILAIWLWRRPPFSGPRSAWTLAALALLCGLSWYARNAVWYGNPVHPVTRDGYIGPYQTIQAGPRASSLAENATAYSASLMDGSEAYNAVLPDSAGLGAATFACGVIACVAALRAGAFPARWAIALAGAAGVTFLLSAHNAWVGRFVLFLAAPGALAAVWAAGRSRAAAAVVVAAALAQAALSSAPASLADGGLSALARLGTADRSLDRTLAPGLPSEGRVGLWTNTRAPQYVLYGPGFAREVVPVTPAHPGELPEILRREKLAAMFVRLDHLLWVEGELARMVRDGRLSTPGKGVYRLPPNP